MRPRAARLGGTTGTVDSAELGGLDRRRAPRPAAGQTDTEWGRIWDTLPSRFPEIPGARPSEEAATGPASATFVIGGDVSRQVAAALVTLLAGAGFPTGGLGTPLENGAYVLEATGPTAGCKLQVTVEPMGGETLVTILYGAACPHD